VESDFPIQSWRVTHARTGDVYVMTCLRDGLRDCYVIRLLQLPPCSYPVGRGHGHVTEKNEICVAPGREPRSWSAARAVAMAFVDGFSEYCRTGTFPASAVRAVTADD
jgi:hypothetical protein